MYFAKANDQVTRVLHVVEVADQSQWLKAERYPSLTSAICFTDPFQEWHTFRLDNVSARIKALGGETVGECDEAWKTPEAWEAA